MKNVDDIYPLTPMQQGMLFHSLLAPDSGIYVEQVRFTLKGNLNIAALKQAMKLVLERHPILRTAFIGEGLKEPVQVVHHQVQPAWHEEDWSEYSGPEQQQRLDAYFEQDRVAGFNLSKAPLFRTALFKTGPDEYQFLFTNHHILMDGWSVPILLGEAFMLYDRCANQQSTDLPVPRPFRDYVRWLQKQDAGRAQQFWKDYLAGFTAPTPLICSRPRPPEEPAVEGYGDEHGYLSPELTAALQALGRRLQVTVPTLLAAAWSLLLGRYSSENDVVFGMTVSGRPPDLPGSESMVGLFINTLPVRVKLEADTRVSDWLKGLQAAQVEIRQYEYSSLVQIKQWSEVPGDLPLFETLMVFENYPTSASLEASQQELVITNIRSHEQTHFPLALIAGPGERLFLRIIYETPRFNRPAVLAMLAHLETLLAGMCEAPDAALRTLTPTTAEERKLILEVWNNTAAPYPDNVCAHQLFEQQVERTPDAPALTFGDICLTYAELNARANWLARRLQALGVGLETVTGLCLERSPDLVVSLLAIMKAGGAYLPLDPSYPPDRIKFMLEDSGVRFVITRPQLTPLMEGVDTTLVLIENTAPDGSQPCDNLECISGPDRLAYEIYTSGSTGKPKGALLRHRGLCNFSQVNARWFMVGPGSRFIQFATFCFDASVAEIFTSLTSGACVVMIPQEIVLSPDKLQEWMAAQHVTTALLPPSLIEYLDRAALPELRVLASAGEKCPLDLALRWSKELDFLNAYGPTEVTVGPTIYHVTSNLEGLTTVPIGSPLQNTRVYILDRDQQLQPVGIPGEICIAGVGLAAGYHNRPDLTAARFVHDPFYPGERMYRSGDLGRFLPDGNVEYLGRLDHQVKIHGFRIELEEIEAALSVHPQVHHAAVLVRGEGVDVHLVAYFVPAGNPPPSQADLRAFLAEKLPHYMLPSSYLPLESLPLSPNGKLDRKALAAIDEAQSRQARSAYIAPRDTLEFQVARVWEDVLGVSPIGMRDSFFELGGHSLLAVRITALIRKKLGKEVPILSLFQEPTVEHMANLLRQETGEGFVRSLVEIQPAGGGRPLFFVHPSAGGVHWYFELAEVLGKEQPFYGLQARGLNGDCPIDTLIPEMAAHYIEEIRALQPQGPYQIGSWSMGVMIAYEMACQLQDQGQEVSLLALLDQGPVLPFPPPADDAEYYQQTFGKQVPLDMDHLRALEPEKQVEYVLAQAKHVGWIFDEVTLDEFSHYVLLLRTHTESWRNYQPRQYSGPITLFRAAVQENPDAARDLGWSVLAGQVEVVDVPGDHLSMVHQPDVAVLAEKMAQHLAGVPEKI